MSNHKTHGESRLRVLLAGEEPVKSAPCVSLAKALRDQAIEVVFSQRAESHSTASWLRVARNCDLIVWLDYQGPDVYFAKQLALAVALGRPLIRWWVGSDVLYCLRERAPRAGACISASLSARNIAVAPHLVEELSSIGIRATFIPMVIDPGFRREIPTSSPRGTGILAYLPEGRAAFYGEAVVERAIRANPDLTFVIVGDDKHRFLGVSNVESLGWVSDMKPVYDRIGCLLRITEHDGLPRMIIEALLLGKHVIYSNHLPGTWLANTYEEVQEGIDRFRRTHSVNTEGVKAVKTLFTPPPEVEFARVIRETLAKPAGNKRIRALLTAINLTVRSRIRKDEPRLQDAKRAEQGL